MRIRRHTVQWRLKCWGKWRTSPRPELARSFSPFGRIREMQENAGAHGDGIVYEIIEGVAVPPDGGMSAAVEQRGREMAEDIRCRETNEAVNELPLRMRNILIETYCVANLEEPRSTRGVEERTGIPKSTVQEQLNEACRRVARKIYGPFEFVEDQPIDQNMKSEDDAVDEQIRLEFARLDESA